MRVAPIDIMLSLLHIAFALAVPLAQASSLSGLANQASAPAGQFIIADYGVGHRSQLVTQWQTSLRSLDLSGTQPKILREFGGPPVISQPIGASALALDKDNDQLYIATGEGVVRSNLDGSNNITVISESASTLTVEGGKIYYGVTYTGLIKRVNLDGSNSEVLLNVSEGINWGLSPTYTPAFRFPAGIAVDKEGQQIYWSSSTNMVDDAALYGGTIRRAPLRAQDVSQSPQIVETLVEGIFVPGQVRLVNGGQFVYWIEQGRWSNSQRAIKRAVIPATTEWNPTLKPQTIVHSNQSSIFFEKDFVPETQTLYIKSFAVAEDEGKLWFAMENDARVMFSKVVEIPLGGVVQESELKVLNKNATEIGIPVGLEYVR
jgi:hypothetical protein